MLHILTLDNMFSEYDHVRRWILEAYPEVWNADQIEIDTRAGLITFYRHASEGPDKQSLWDPVTDDVQRLQPVTLPLRSGCPVAPCAVSAIDATGHRHGDGYRHFIPGRVRGL